MTKNLTFNQRAHIADIVTNSAALKILELVDEARGTQADIDEVERIVAAQLLTGHRDNPSTYTP